MNNCKLKKFDYLFDSCFSGNIEVFTSGDILNQVPLLNYLVILGNSTLAQFAVKCSKMSESLVRIPPFVWLWQCFHEIECLLVQLYEMVFLVSSSLIRLYIPIFEFV